MSGGPSHLETFDYKPKLAAMDGRPMPESFTRGQPIAQLQGQALRCLGPQFRFHKHGRSGQEIADVLPYTARLGGVTTHARHKKVLELAKGYRGRGSTAYRIAIEKVEKGLRYAYRDRRNKKRDFRGLWIQRINAGAREHGLTYSQFMHGHEARRDRPRPQGAVRSRDPRARGLRRRSSRSAKAALDAGASRRRSRP